jgi:uncharacterized coiled-coil DUF342 family protein
MTSAELGKKIKKLSDDLEALKVYECKVATYVVSANESVSEDDIPKYDFADIQRQIEEKGKEIRQLKHKLNVFNSTTYIPKLGMTVDQVLVLIPQLTERKHKLSTMSARLSRERIYKQFDKNGVAEYRCVNYDIDEVRAEYERICSMLTEAQTELDVVNTTFNIQE